MPFFAIGDVRVAEDSDVKEFMSVCEDNEGWTLEINKPDLLVWNKPTPESDFKIVKVMAKLKDIPAPIMYDVLHDPDYRKVWDRSMIKSKDICMINPNNDIGYYAMKSPPPFKNRDFVTQRTWLQTPTEYVIFNHSVFHKEMPPQKNFIRSLSYLTGYLIRPVTEDSSVLTYVAQCDPRGKLPAWAVNKATQYVAPKVITRLFKAAQKYPSWKKKHNPDLKPWLYPEQITIPRINFQHILSTPDFLASTLDESEVTETATIFDTMATEDLNGDSPMPSGKVEENVD